MQHLWSSSNLQDFLSTVDADVIAKDREEKKGFPFWTFEEVNESTIFFSNSFLPVVLVEKEKTEVIGRTVIIVFNED